MRRLALALSLSLTLPLPLAARADDPKAKAADDLKAFQGEWVARDEMTGDSTWVFKGDRLTITAPTRGYECKVKLDPGAKPEKSIDFDVLDDSPNAKGARAEGIYKLDGETLSICFNGPDGARPKEFKNDFPQSLLFQLKRKK